MFSSQFFLQLSVAGLLSEASYIFASTDGYPAPLPSIIYLVYGLLIYLLNALVLRKERKINTLIFINFFLAAGTAAAVLLTRGPLSFSAVASTLIIVILLTGLGVSLNTSEVKLNAHILALDISVVFVIIFAAMVAAVKMEPVWIIPGAIAVACGLISVILKRIDRTPTPRDAGLIIGILIITFGIAALFVIFAAAPAGNGLVELYRLFILGAKMVWHAIELFAEWLASLFKPVPMDASGIEMQPMPSIDTEEYEYGDPAVAIVLFSILAAAIIAVLVVLLVRIRKIRIGALKMGKLSKVSAGKENRLSFKEAFKLMLERRRINALKKKFLRENADTPLGIYYKIELQLRHGKNRKLAGETPRQFITRLEDALAEKIIADENVSAGDKEANVKDIRVMFGSLKDRIDETMFGPYDNKAVHISDKNRLLKLISSI